MYVKCNVLTKFKDICILCCSTKRNNQIFSSFHSFALSSDIFLTYGKSFMMKSKQLKEAFIRLFYYLDNL